jgi:DNA-directed RNA polymerase specialized sigma24 family protein
MDKAVGVLGMTPYDAASAADIFDFVRSMMSWRAKIILDLMVKGYTATEIAKTVRVPLSRAKSLMRQTRKAAREALRVESLD